MKIARLLSSALIILQLLMPHSLQAANEMLGSSQAAPPGISLTESLQNSQTSSDSEVPQDFFTQETTLAAAEAAPLFLGVEEGGTVSGVVEIRPNESQLPGLRKVAYYLNGTQSGKVYQSPFIWGGVSGNGTAGFDTRTIADGDYTLAMVYTDAAGDHEIQIHFTINNSNPNPNPSPSPNPLPSTTPIPPSGRTLGGETFPTGTSFIDVEKSGNYSFLAEAGAVTIVDSSNPADNQILSRVTFETPVIDIQAAPNGAGFFVLELGVFLNGQFRSRLWFVNTTDPTNPVVQAKADLRDGKRLSTSGTRLNAYYTSSGENFLVDCALSGAGDCTVGFYNLYMTPDLVHTHQSFILSAAVGGSSISLNHNDVTQTPTAAPVSFFSGQNNYLYVSLENGTLAIYDVNQADTGEQGTGLIPVASTHNPDGNDPVMNYIFNNRLAVLDSTGLIEIYDLANPVNPVRVDSVTVPGARGLDFDGTNLYVVTDREYRIVGPAPGPNPSPTPNPSPSNSPIVGVTEGQTVSGIVTIGPNQAQLPGIRKVAYYLNGSKSGKVYQSPFTWGGLAGDGTTGFDTRTLADGTYELALVYTDATGDHEVSVRFNVDN
jgi:hypothetical protein